MTSEQFKLIAAIEKQLWAIICRGGGDSETLSADAKRIAGIARRYIAKEKAK